MNVHFETSPGIRQFRPDVVLKQISDSVELHNIFWLAFQPEFVKLNEKITAIEEYEGSAQELVRSIPVEMMKVFNGRFVWVDIIEMRF